MAFIELAEKYAERHAVRQLGPFVRKRPMAAKAKDRRR